MSTKILVTYTQDLITKIEGERKVVTVELNALCLSLVTNVSPSLTVRKANEYLLHGVCRRLKIIGRCIDNIFTIFPIKRWELLTEQERSDLEINLHAFIINVNGLQDNLAWVYLLEKSLENKVEKGQAGVGLFNKHTQVHLPEEVRAYLKTEAINSWHVRYAKDYRDALAHRIPPYIPPSQMTAVDAQMYQELEKQIFAQIEGHDSERAIDIMEQQQSLGSICAVFLHSSTDSDSFAPVFFHPQVVVDGKTVIEITRMIFRHVP